MTTQAAPIAAHFGSPIMKLPPAVRIPRPCPIQTTPATTSAAARTSRSGERGAVS